MSKLMRLSSSSKSVSVVGTSAHAYFGVEGNGHHRSPGGTDDIVKLIHMVAGGEIHPDDLGRYAGSLEIRDGFFQNFTVGNHKEIGTLSSKLPRQFEAVATGSAGDNGEWFGRRYAHQFREFFPLIRPNVGGADALD